MLLRAPRRARLPPALLRRGIGSASAADDGGGAAFALDAAEAARLAAGAVRVARVPGVGGGRGLVARRRARPGEVLLLDEPLVAVSSAADAGAICQSCFARAPAGGGEHACACGYAYCSPACRAAAWAAGHDALCGGTRALDAACEAAGAAFPRAAAHLLARSLSAGADFAAFWARVNRLAHASVGLPADAPPEAFPRSWREGHALVRGALAPRLGGPGVDAFFRDVFSLRFYGRVMGVLRLNSVAFDAPIEEGRGGEGRGARAGDAAAGGGGSTAGGGGSAGSGGGWAEAELVAGAGGCCSTDGGAAPVAAAACGDGGAGGACAPDGGGGGGAGVGAGSAGAGRGVALYPLLSLANHACEPAADVVVGAGAGVALVARRALDENEPVTLAYVPADLPVLERRRRLRLYGFECECARCREQLLAAGHRL